VSACVLLLPPLVIAAGVIVFGSSPQQGTEPEGPAQQAAASQTIVAKSAEQPDGVTRFALASAEQHPVFTKQHPDAEEHPGTEQPPVIAQGQASGRPRVAKDPSPYDPPVPIATSDYGPITVTLVQVRKSSEQSAMADVEAAPSTVRTGHASPAVVRIHASHASRRMGPHGSRSVHRVKQEHARLVNEPRRMAGIAAGTGAGERRAQGYQSRRVRQR
jgi:hypothetical protein